MRNFVAVENSVGSFSVDDAFRITGRGWVLAGELQGQIEIGYRLNFGNEVVLHVSGVEMLRKVNTDNFGLLVSNQFDSRQELIDLNIIGATAQILE